ncbi:MAG: TlpA family protein disulfide reductase [Rubrivivax sp.]|nr:TlpA family protein disulfide reductase [Pyrinomonadaceae bacterium]
MTKIKQEQNKQGFWTTGRTAFTFIVFVFAAFAISSCTANDTANLTANANKAPQPSKPKVTITSNQGAQPQATKPAGLDVVPPEVWNAEIPAVGGGTIRLSDFKDKIIVLNLWATWCGPCRLEIPHLVELNNEYKGKGVEMVGLTTESQLTDTEKVNEFAKQFKITYKLGWANANIALPLMAGNSSIPQSFVIAPGGRIVSKFRGFSPQIPGMIRAAIEKANDKAGD